MAKKVLTPEQAEIKAMKKAKKSENWTKFWAIVLAAVLTFGVFSLGKSAGEDAAAAAATVGATTGTTTSGTTGTTTGTTTSGTTGTTTGTTTSGTTGTTAGSENAATSEAVSAADVAKAFNDATAKAASGSYEFTRVCAFQDGKGIQVSMLGGDATSTLNSVIQTVDENADLNSVVGGFLGEGTRKIKVTNGVGVRVKDDNTTAELSVDEQFYLLKAMSLQEGDLVNPAKNGNVYSFALANVADPQRDGKNAMHRATNDFITEDRVKEAISSLTSAITVQSANVSYYDIYFEATIEDGTLKSLKMSYKGDAVMKLKVALTIDGSGSLEVESNYVF